MMLTCVAPSTSWSPPTPRPKGHRSSTTASTRRWSPRLRGRRSTWPWRSSATARRFGMGPRRRRHPLAERPRLPRRPEPTRDPSSTAARDAPAPVAAWGARDRRDSTAMRPAAEARPCWPMRPRWWWRRHDVRGFTARARAQEILRRKGTEFIVVSSAEHPALQAAFAERCRKMPLARVVINGPPPTDRHQRRAGETPPTDWRREPRPRPCCIHADRARPPVRSCGCSSRSHPTPTCISCAVAAVRHLRSRHCARSATNSAGSARTTSASARRLATGGDVRRTTDDRHGGRRAAGNRRAIWRRHATTRRDHTQLRHPFRGNVDKLPQGPAQSDWRPAATCAGRLTTCGERRAATTGRAVAQHSHCGGCRDTRSYATIPRQCRQTRRTADGPAQGTRGRDRRGGPAQGTARLAHPLSHRAPPRETTAARRKCCGPHRKAEDLRCRPGFCQPRRPAGVTERPTGRGGALTRLAACR